MKSIVKRVLKASRGVHLMLETPFDSRYLSPDVKPPKLVSHENWQHYLSAHFNKPGLRVLEIGSREVTGKSAAALMFPDANYTGFDFYAGPNVDVVGDAHRLTDHFAIESFDLIYSSACFEHFAMPWVVAEQIGKLLRVGGSVFVETHFSYSSHERPWNFFQFSDMGLRALFSPAMGFECIDSGMSTPIVGRISSLASVALRNRPVPGLYCHSEYLGRKIRQVDGFDWRSASLANVVNETEYPRP